MRRLLIAALSLLLLLSLLPAGRASEALLYEIEVDVSSQITTIYRAGETTEQGIVRQMACSTGAYDHTPKGTFELIQWYASERSEWYWIKEYECYVRWPVRITEHFLFHSLPYTGKSEDKLDQKALSEMGKATSHGCIRLFTEDAEWIAKNCPNGTKCTILKSGDDRKDLLTLLLDGSYTEDRWESYDAFMGRTAPEDHVSASSTRLAIRELQWNLRSFGYYDGAQDGRWDTSLMLAVANASEAAGLPRCRTASPELMNALREGTLPVSTEYTLTEGMHGRQTAQLLHALKKLGYYTGTDSDVFTAELKEAVSLFAKVNELKDIADRTLQEAALAQAEAFSYPYSENYTLVLKSKTKITAKTNTAASLRKKEDTKSKRLKTIPKNTAVTVLKKGKKTTKVSYGGTTGYVKTGTLDFATRKILTAAYSCPEVAEVQRKLADMGLWTNEIDGIMTEELEKLIAKYRK